METNEAYMKLAEVEQIEKTNSRRIDQLEKRQDDLDGLVSSVAVMATKQETIEKDVGEIKSDVKELAGKPGKRWESVVEKIILAVVAAVVGFILCRVGLQ